jgi:hypothetical protein
MSIVGGRGPTCAVGCGMEICIEIGVGFGIGIDVGAEAYENWGSELLLKTLLFCCEDLC